MVRLKRPHFTKKYARYRIKSPAKFKKSSFRAHDIGRPGHSKRIAGRLKKTNRWRTQSVLVTRKDYRAGKRVKKIRGRPVIFKLKRKK